MLTQSSGYVVQGISEGLERRLTPTQPAISEPYSVVVHGTTIIAFSRTGRYVARSLDGGLTWQTHDYGADVNTTYVQVTRSQYYGAVLVAANGIAYSVNTAVWPPTRALQGDWAIGANAAAELDQTNGDIFLIGQIVTSGPVFHRSGFRVIQDANVFSALKVISTSLYYIGGMIRTVAGTYIGSMRDGSTATAIGRSTNSTTWNFHDATTHAAVGLVTRALQLPSGRIIYGRFTATGSMRDIRYSDDDGLTWAAATIPAIPANFGYPYWDATAGRAVFLCNDGVTAVVSTDGITWTLASITGEAGAGFYYAWSEFSTTVDLS